MRSRVLSGVALAVAVGACCVAASGAAASKCKPEMLPSEVLRLVKPLLRARIQEQEEMQRTGREDPESRAARKVDELFTALLKDDSPAGDRAVAYLLTVYMGEAPDEDTVCEVVARGPRMLPLVRAIAECRPLTGLEPRSRIIDADYGPLVASVLEDLEAGRGCDE